MTANIPNVAGRAMTVRGPIDPDQLRITLMHEHLFVATTRTYTPDDNTPATEWRLWEQDQTRGWPTCWPFRPALISDCTLRAPPDRRKQ